MVKLFPKILSLIITMHCSWYSLDARDKVWEDQNKKLSIVKICAMHEFVFKNLQLCYESEFSPITQTSMTTTGDYDQDALADHWSREHDLYVFYVDNIPAGLAEVNYGSMIEKEDEVHDIGEFYITPIFRKKGYGRIFAQAVLKLYAGAWQIRQLPELENTARRFWLNVIATIDHEEFQEIINHPGWPGFVQCFSIKNK